MDDPIVRIAAVILGLVLLYFLIRAVFIWLSEFFRQSIPFTQRLFVILVVLLLIFSWFYPDKTQYLFEQFLGLVKAATE